MLSVMYDGKFTHPISNSSLSWEGTFGADLVIGHFSCMCSSPDGDTENYECPSCCFRFVFGMVTDSNHNVILFPRTKMETPKQAHLMATIGHRQDEIKALADRKKSILKEIFEYPDLNNIPDSIKQEWEFIVLATETHTAEIARIYKIYDIDSKMAINIRLGEWPHITVHLFTKKLLHSK